MNLLALPVVALTLATSLAVARWVEPAASTRGRRLERLVVWLIVFATTASVTACWAGLTSASESVRRGHLLDVRRVTAPGPADLASLRGAPRPPDCDVVWTIPISEGGGSWGSLGEQSLRRCGPARFVVSRVQAHDLDRYSTSEHWEYPNWTCASDSDHHPDWRNPRVGASSEVTRQVRVRASADGGFVEFSCHLVESTGCGGGSCGPAAPDEPTPAPLYLRARDLRVPIALGALALGALSMLALAWLRRSAARLVPADDPVGPGPYRSALLTSDERLARLRRSHSIRLWTVAALVTVVHALGWWSVLEFTRRSARRDLVPAPPRSTR